MTTQACLFLGQFYVVLVVRQEREHLEAKSADSEVSTMKIDVGKMLPDTEKCNLGIFCKFPSCLYILAQFD